jgi:ABC-type transporter Mla subunit MlaD
VSDAIFAGLNAATNASGQLEDALNRTLLAADKSGAAVLDSFSGLVNAEDRVLGFSKLVTDNGTQIELGNERLISSVEDTQAAFDKLKGADPETARRTLDELQVVTDGLDRNSGQWKANQEFIDRNRESLDLQAQAAEVSGGELDNLAGQFDNLDPVVEETTFKVEGLTIKTQEATDAFKAYADALRANTDPFFAVIDAAGAFGDAQVKVAEAFTELFTDGATTQEIIDFANAQRDAVEAGLNLEGAIANLRSEVEQGNITYGSGIEVLDLLVQKYPQLRDQVKQVKDQFFFAGLEAQNLQDQSPVDLSVTANVQPVLDGLTRLSGGLFAIKSNADLAAESVVNLFGGIFNSQNKSKQPMPNLPFNAYIPPQFRRAQGGPVLSGQSYLVGEQGPEMFVPRTSGTIVPNNGTMGNVQQTFNITTGDPILTAAEVVRRQRDAEFLAGV